MKKLFFVCAVIVLLVTPSVVFSATSWYMPEGSTQGFDLWILVTNPNNATVNIKFTFYYSDGTNTGSITYTPTDSVAANSRYSLWVNRLAAQAGYTDLQNKAISTKVECTNGYNMYAERAMYWPSAYGTTVDGTTSGHTSRAVSGLEGCYTEISQPSSFPITITRSGSYKLIGDITCATLNVNGIEITASNVTLDLNGFSITGPGFGSTDGSGVYIAGQYYINIVNGTIASFSKYGIYASECGGLYCANLKMCENGTGGIILQSSVNCVIEKCQVYYNSAYGIQFVGTSYSIIRDNVCNSSSTPLRITDISTYNRIERNHCIGDGTTDIYCSDDSINNLVTENTYKNAITVSGVTNKITITNQGNIDLE